MHRLLSVPVFLSLTLTAAATEVVGPVSGTWAPSGNPYNVVGEITVPDRHTLVIQSGVQVIFQGHYKFVILGNLEAIGTEEDSILFTASNTSTGFWGLRFYSQNTQADSSRLIYCHISYGISSSDNNAGYDKAGGAIFASYSSKLRISHCLIEHNQTGDITGFAGSNGTSTFPNGNSGGSAITGKGGAIYATFSDLTIQDCVFKDNHTGQARGGNGGNGFNSVPGVSPGNGGTGGSGESGRGGAIYAESSFLTLSNNQFIQNSTGSAFGGAGGHGGSQSTEGYTVAVGKPGGNGSYGTAGAGGVFYLETALSYPSPSLFQNNLFAMNQTGTGTGGAGGAGGAGINYETPSHSYGGDGGNGGAGTGGNGSAIVIGTGGHLNNLTITQNTAGAGIAGPGGAGGYSTGNPGDPGSPGPAFAGNAALYCTNSNNVALTNSILWQNRGGMYYNLLQVTYSCMDILFIGPGNIATDPQFLNPVQGPFYLSQIAAGQPVQSPCVNAGNPDSSLFPGTTRSDGVQDSGIVDLGYHYYCFIPQGVLVVFPILIQFAAICNGPNPPDQIVQISNHGSCNFSFQAQNSASWMTLTPLSGGPIAPEMSDTITLSVNIAGLSPGVYLDSIIITAPGAEGSPETLFVNLNVLPASGVSPGQQTQLPTHFALDPPHPNPFNPTTAISYRLASSTPVHMTVHDVQGRLVTTLVDGMQEAGQHSVTFDGSRLASGIYLYTLVAGQNTATGKMVLMK